MTEYRKTGHTLPQDVVDTFNRLGDDLESRNLYSAALRSLGWTLASISSATGVTRERVRQTTTGTPEGAGVEWARANAVPLPTPPTKPVRVRKTYVEPDPRKLEKLLELQPAAQQNRHNSEEFREAAEEYTRLVWEVHNADGVTLYRLAKRLDVTHGALRFRLARYGYKEPESGVSKVYTRIMPEHRL